MGSRILEAGVDDLRRDRTSVKWRAYGAGVLPLWIAEMDAAPCREVVEAVSAAMARGDTGYAWSQPYADALASFARDEWGWHLDPRSTTPVSDVLGGVAHLLRLLTEPGGPVVVSSPVYNAFFSVIESVGRRVVEAPLTARGRLDPDTLADTFSALAARGERAVYLLCNPHNPTGTVHAVDELARLAALADEYDVRVLSDEIHGPLVYAPARFVPYLTVPGSERGITVTSASKAWNLAGLKAGVIVPGAEAVADVRRLHPFVTFGASHLGVIAHTAAYEQGRPWLHRLAGELDENRRLLAQLVARHLPGAELLVPDATYLAWLDCRGLGLEGDPAEWFRKRAGVALSDGPSFGTPGTGHVRINFATSPALLREAVSRMAGSLA
jgi:cystathionine beta-lyase